MKKNSPRFAKLCSLRVPVAAVISYLAFLATPIQVSAAGLGKVVVFSALGQPLRAEIEVNASAAELSGMRVQLASPNAFKQAGLDYTTSLRGITFTLDRRAGKKPVIRVASDAPISEPLVDMLVELNWSTGRLVREYTFLLDPPEIAARNARIATVPVAHAAASVPRQSSSASPASLISEETRARARATIQGLGYVRLDSSAQTSVPVAPAKTKTTNVGNRVNGETYVVRQGDTLNKIASATKPDGVTLEQMLIGLLRANQQAFGGGNMNRLKAGKILTIPDKGAVESIAPGEARKIIATQTAEWYAYRNKLASVAAKSSVTDSEAQQGVTGKITAKVEDKFPESAESADRVKVSGASAGREDAIARDKALKEAGERVAMLEQNVAKLQQLLELKDQTLAELQKQADVAKERAASEPTPQIELPKVGANVVSPPTSTPASTEVPTFVGAASASAEGKEAPVATPPVTPEPSAAPANTQASTPLVPEESTNAKVRPVRPSSPPPPPEPDFIETLMSDPMLLLAAGGSVLALLGGLVFFRRRRAHDGGEAQSMLPLGLTTPSISGNNLTANSVFRNTAGGQSVDTSHASQSDFGQASPGSIDVEEVDPVAEADVYMAYGRDAQAEEILMEAKRKNPGRHAIDLKLLEIYADRRDTKQLDTLAKELYLATGGEGQDWEKAVTIGQRIDPENPLFKAGGVSMVTVAQSAAPAATPKTASTVPIHSQSVAETAAFSMSVSESKKPETASVLETTLDMSNLDFDLGAGKADAARAQALDFSLDAPAEEVAQPQPEAAKEASFASSTLDFTLPASDSDQVLTTTRPNTAPVAPLANDLEFDVDLTESTFLGKQAPRPESNLSAQLDTPVVPGLPHIDMSSIDLDLEATQPVPKRMPAGTLQGLAAGAGRTNPEAGEAQLSKVGLKDDLSGAGAHEDVSTKLDLAKAYEEMGDLDGARELLREVAKEGNFEQREKARSFLTELGN